MLKRTSIWRLSVALGCAAVVSWLSGCGKEGTSSTATTPGSVFFSIESVPVTSSADAETRCWRGTYDSGGKRAVFRIEIVVKKPGGDSAVAFTKGTFYRERGSEPEILLRRIADALEARGPLRSPQRVDMLPFTAAILGTDLSRGTGRDTLAGSFTSSPKGAWTAVKVFVADGEGEFFLNLNPAGKTGEISIKDPEYGDIVVGELAKVL